MTSLPSKASASSRRTNRARDRRKKSLWRSAALLFTVLGILALVGLLWSNKAAAPAAKLPAVVIPTQRVVRGDPMPDVAWPDQQGKLVHVSDFAGQPVLVNAWATWCPPCKAEMPLLHDLYRKYKDQGLVVLAVNAAEETGTVQQFLQANPFTFPVLLDPTGEAINKLGIVNFPTSILVGRDGIVQYIYIGEITPQALQDVVIPLLDLGNG